MDCMKDEMSEFVDSSGRIKKLCDKACRQNSHITLFCGGSFSGKHRCGREFARMLAAKGNSSYCFQIDLPFRLKHSPEESLEIGIIKFVVKEMKKYDLFEKDVEEICQESFNTEVFFDFFSKHKRSNFIFVFDDADIVVVKDKLNDFLTTLKAWTENCRNVNVVLTTQFIFTLYENCLTYNCESLEKEDGVIFLKNEIQRFNISLSSDIEVPSEKECKKLVELVNCWPFLIMVLARELEDFSADEMVELLTTTPLLTLSNEAASQTDQLDYKLEHMLMLLSDKLKKETSSFAPEVKQFFTVKEIIEVSEYKYRSVAEAKQALKPLRIRSIVEKKDGGNNFAFVDFMKDHINDNALDTFQPSTFKNKFVRMIGELVLNFLRNTLKCSDDELRKCRQRAALQLKTMLDKMKEFVSKAEHPENQDLKDSDFEKVIKAAEDFCYRATRQKDPEFREKACLAKEEYTRGTDKARRQDSEESGIDINETHEEQEEPVASVTPKPVASDHKDTLACVDISVGPRTLRSDANIENVENPLHQIGCYQQQSCSPHGPQETTAVFREDVEDFINISQETFSESSRDGCVVPSGYESIPLKATMTRH